MFSFRLNAKIYFEYVKNNDGNLENVIEFQALAKYVKTFKNRF